MEEEADGSEDEEDEGAEEEVKEAVEEKEDSYSWKDNEFQPTTVEERRVQEKENEELDRNFSLLQPILLKQARKIPLTAEEKITLEKLRVEKKEGEKEESEEEEKEEEEEEEEEEDTEEDDDTEEEK